MKESFINIAKRFDYLHLLVLLISILCCKHYLGHTISPLYDIGREIMYPAMINEGNVLYKDIFCLFGPFSYMFTAFIYKLFGTSLHTFFITACAFSLLIVSGVYNLAKSLLGRNYAFIISVFTIIIGITNVNFCNASYIAPYSTAIIYGLSASIWSVYFLIKSFGNSIEKQNLYIISSFLAGIAVCCKYEFVFFAALVFVYACIELFKKNKKALILSFSALCLPSAVCFGILFFRGLTISELYNSFILIKNLILTPFYQYFYREYGTILSIKSIKFCIINFIQFCIIIGIYALMFKVIKNKLLLAILASITAFFIFCFKVPYINEYLKADYFLAFLPILTALVLLFKFKHLDKPVIYLALSSVFISYKVFWNLSLSHYGVFFAPLLIIALFAMVTEKNRKVLCTFIIVLSSCFLFEACEIKSYTNNLIKTDNTPLYTDYMTAKKINKIIRYIKQNTKSDDKVVVYPEGLLINFIADRKADIKYYALNPENVELFGENNIINHFKENPPKCFILTPKLNVANPKLQICKEYGKDFCKYLKENYNEKVIFRIEFNPDDSAYAYTRKN